MEVVILKTDGTPVRLDEKFTKAKFDTEGFLVGFVYGGEIYKYIQNEDFGYRKKDKDLSGYYSEKVFYENVSIIYQPSEQTKRLILEKFPFFDAEAQKDDQITVNVTDFSVPYNYFYKENKYTFNIELVDHKIKKYRRRVYDNNVLVGYEIDLPASSFPGTPNDVNLMDEPTGYFFRKNFGEFVDNWDISEIGKSNYKKFATLSASKINYIVEDIIKYIFPQNSLARIYNNANNGTSIDPDPNDLSRIEKLIFTLLWDWGYFYNPSDDPKYIYKAVINPVMSGLPEYYQYSRYYNSLSQFYFVTNRERETLKDLNDDEKIRYLLSILPMSALRAIPYVIIKQMLSDFAKKDNLSEEDEELIVRLVLAVDTSEADDFLDFLLRQENGIVTNFEALYKLLDDARLERYTIVNWFVEEETNRKYYVYAAYELWKVSKYNSQYIPSGTQNLEDVDVNPNAYFIQNSDLFNFNNVLTFGSSDASSDGLIQDVEISFESSFKAKEVKINKKKKIIKYQFSNSGFAEISIIKLPPETTFFGTFHLYQSLALVGYTANFDLKIPESSNIPAFMYHYVKEYDELADFDAGVTLAIDLTIEAVLFYFTGGASVLKDLRYLKYVTRLGKALRNKLPATELIELWRGLDSAAETFNLTAGILTAVNEYLITTEEDEIKRGFKERLRILFIGLIIVGSGAAAYSRSRTVKEASKIIDDINALPTGVAHGVSPEVISLLRRIKGDGNVTMTLFSNKLNTLNLGNVRSKFDLFTEDLKLAFWSDFKDLDEAKDLASWLKLNEDVKYMDNWRDMHVLEALEEAKTVTFITNQGLINAAKRYYVHEDIRKILARRNINDRIRFFNSFGSNAQLDAEIFAVLQQSPDGVTLLFQVLRPLRDGVDVFLTADVFKILRGGLKEAHIGLLVERNSFFWGEVTYDFARKFKVKTVSIPYLQDLNNRFKGNLTGNKLKLFQKKNRLFVSTEIYQDTTLIDAVPEFFISGLEDAIKSIYRQGDGTINLPTNLTEIDYRKLSNFNIKALDVSGIDRFEDTEMKYVFNFLEQHWHRGNRFKITMESVLYSCTSCQRYLLSLQKYARSQGKIIDIEFVAHNEATSIPILNKLLLKP